MYHLIFYDAQFNFFSFPYCDFCVFCGRNYLLRQMIFDKKLNVDCLVKYK